MQVKSLLLIGLVAFAGTVSAQKKKTKVKKAKAAAAQAAPQLQSYDGKTFSYALGVLQGESLRNYVVQREGVDSAYMEDVIKGMEANPNSPEAKRAIAYAAGLKVGAMNRNNLMQNINQEATGKTDTAYFNLDSFTRALADVLMRKPTGLSADSAKEIVEGQAKYSQEKYRLANEQWLKDNLKNKGIKTTKSGLQYRVLVEGKGAMPSDTSKVEVNYEGKLINGKVFDSSYERNEPASFRVDQVIKGWTEALKMMPEGSTWEIFIPANLAYGERHMQSIPANSTLIFKVELLKSNVKK